MITRIVRNLSFSLPVLFLFTSFSSTPPPGISYSSQTIDYIIIPDRETDCISHFPNGLSSFLKDMGGYEHYSEVYQVSNVLDIDLNAFQHYDYGALTTKEESRFWQDIDTFTVVVDNFIKKLTNSPDYYQLVRHNTDKELRDEQLKLASKIRNSPDFVNQLKELYKLPAGMFPPDNGGLRNNELLKQLKELKTILSCYKKAHVTKIKLFYKI